jgi:hypothetical protein
MFEFEEEARMNTAAQTVLASDPAARSSCSPSVPDRFRKLEKDRFDVIASHHGG